MDLITQLETIVPDISDLADGVAPDQYGAPTPCSGFAVRDLMDHMIGGASAFGPQLLGGAPGEPPDDLTDEARPKALRSALDSLLEAAKAPGAFESSVELPFGTVPGEVLVRFLTVDGMVHSSDLARATGQAYQPDEALAAEVLGSARALIAPEMRDGDTFAAEVPAPAGADPLTALVAFTGRAV
jgi:uncharacterized protein (TIGR03086 family)